MNLNQTYETRRVADLTPHPRNPRHGDIAAIRGSIEANGFYGAVVVQKSTGYVLAGNHRMLAARDAGIAELPCIVLDVDDARAARIMLADNRTAMLGTDDIEAVLRLVNEDLGGEPEGTGYSAEALEELLAVVQPESPPDFPSINPDEMQTEYCCPKCKYEWSGKPK